MASGSDRRGLRNGSGLRKWEGPQGVMGGASGSGSGLRKWEGPHWSSHVIPVNVCAEHGAGGSEQSVAEEASASDLHCWSTRAAATAAG